MVRTGATGKGNEWRLTARAKTKKDAPVDVYVNNEQNTLVTTIAVTVLNSLPTRTTTDPSKALLDLTMVDILDTETCPLPIPMRCFTAPQSRQGFCIGRRMMTLVPLALVISGGSTVMWMAIQLSFEIEVVAPSRRADFVQIGRQGVLA